MTAERGRSVLEAYEELRIEAGELGDRLVRALGILWFLERLNELIERRTR